MEAVWWVEETGTQWRIKGRAFVVGNDIEGPEQSSGVRTVKSEVGKRMRVIDAGKEGDWSWTRELTASFGNQSPGIKGTCLFAPIENELNFQVRSEHPRQVNLQLSRTTTRTLSWAPR